MNAVNTIARKELRALFQSPVAMIFLVVFLAFALFTFFTGSAFFARNIADVRPLFQWLPLLLIGLVSAVTMRSWAEERKAGTLEVLLTLPVPVSHLVLGKFLSGLALIGIALALTLPLPLMVSTLGELDWGPVIGGYLGALLLGSTYLAIGLAVSARTDNQIVALMVTLVLGGLLYLVGTDAVAALLSNNQAEAVRAIGTGSRFESIERGVIDIRDLVYYGSLSVFFLVLNVVFLEQERIDRGEAPEPIVRAGAIALSVAGAIIGAWLLGRGIATEQFTATQAVQGLAVVAAAVALFGAFGAASARASDVDGAVRSKRLTWLAAAVGINALLANLWLAPITGLRVDLTANGDYSIDPITGEILDGLDEKLVIHGYFSERTHPLLAPLVPQIRDLLTEYGVQGGDGVDVSFFDPATNEELEQEIGEQYAIRSFPFGVTDRNSQAVVNSFFHVLVRYGDEYEVLSFQELIEVQPGTGGEIDVRLRNLEYDLTRTIKRVSQDFQSLEAIFAKLPQQTTFTAYVTPALVPEDFKSTVDAMSTVGQRLAGRSGGKVTFAQVDPTGDRALQEKLFDEYGVRPLAKDLFGQETFYLHMVLDFGDSVERILPRGQLKEADLEQAIEAAVKRATPGQLKTVGVFTEQPEAPPPNPQLPPQFQPPPPQPDYRGIQQQLADGYQIRPLQLADGFVPDEIDVLVVGKAGRMSEEQKFAVDQYLMRGGSVIAMAGSYRVSAGRQGLSATAEAADLGGLLGTWGVNVEQALVMDPQNAPFPIPVTEQKGQFRVQRVEMLDYPMFPDIRATGFNREHPALAGIGQVTMPWASPVGLAETLPEGLQGEVLLTTSDKTWLNATGGIDPDFTKWPDVGFGPSGDAGAKTVAVALTGSFPSNFAGKPTPGFQRSDGGPGRALDSSVADGRLVVFGSGELVSDLLLQLAQQPGGEVHRSNLQLIQNAIDWAVEDTDLLAIRSSGAFARTLFPIEDAARTRAEWTTYLLVLIPLLFVVLMPWWRRRRVEPIAVTVGGAK